jgi:hypothetical protein
LWPYSGEPEMSPAGAAPTSRVYPSGYAVCGTCVTKVGRLARFWTVTKVSGEGSRPTNQADQRSTSITDAAGQSLTSACHSSPVRIPVELARADWTAGKSTAAGTYGVIQPSEYHSDRRYPFLTGIGPLKARQRVSVRIPQSDSRAQHRSVTTHGQRSQ